MTSTPKVFLVVKDCDDVTVVEDEIDGIVTGAQLFKEMNSRCEFGKWSRADALGPHVQFNVMKSHNQGDNEASATRILQDIIDSLVRAEVQCEFMFKVQKKEEFRDAAADSPEGPEYPLNPGLRPRHGPDYGGFETPGGPQASLARMRGMLARV
jgi:hypothetical protein